MLSDSEKQKIMLSLIGKIDDIKCPMCGNGTFSILDGYVINHIHNDIQYKMNESKISIPTIMMVCTKCGFISQHALGHLGNLPKSVRE